MLNPRQNILNQVKLPIKIISLKVIQHLINKQKIKYVKNRFRISSENGHFKLVKIIPKSMVNYCCLTNLLISNSMFNSLSLKIRVKAVGDTKASHHLKFF